jgi:hypothetical protein
MSTQLRLHIDVHEPFANGMRFGEAGPYERLSGRVAFALHPASPPYQSHEYAVLTPSIDADGNDVPGLHTPDLMVPLATYTGWNVRTEGAGGKAMYSISGSYMPFGDLPEVREESASQHGHRQASAFGCWS